MGKSALKNTGFSNSQQRAPGILIPLHGVDGSIVGHQYRPDKPREDKKRERLIKYENPVGASVRVDCPPRCRPQLGDPAVPLYITEGIKKVDALACAGACAIALTGVWGFKGKNPVGGTTILADFDYIALKERHTYLVFDSDSNINPHVRQALMRLSEHLGRKGAQVRIIELAPGPGGEKVGADDYLAQGKTIADLATLEKAVEPGRAETIRQWSHNYYCIEEGRISWVKQEQHGETVIPLCNFNAQITEIITRDDGLDETKAFKVVGFEGSGRPLPTIEVPTSNLESMAWVTAEWDTRAIIRADQTSKPRLREAILLQSQEAARRTVYTHTGWRDIGGQPVFLTASGALGRDDIDVELEEDLQRYSLPAPVQDPAEALRASYEFLQVANESVTLPLWSAMYLAPLSEILEPAFTLFIVGHSGSFKSTISALALAHFGATFDEFHLPAAWRDTENKLEKLLYLAKDLPIIIDDWAPGQDTAKSRELEVKAEHVIRAQGNRQGRGRLRADTSSRRTYIPRGVLITSGEQLPSGYSHTARIFSVEIDASIVDMAQMSAAQAHKHLYSQAMAHYILWLQNQWGDLHRQLPRMYEQWREKARADNQHPRLPGVVAWLYAGLTHALDFMTESGVIEENEAREVANRGLDTFIKLSSEQGGRIESERPARRFMKLFRALRDQGRITLWPKDDDEPRRPIPGETPVGWIDSEGYIFLNPTAAYSAIRHFSQYTDAPFTFKEHALWKDMRQLNYIESANGRNQVSTRIYGQPRWVIKLRPWVVYEASPGQGEVEFDVSKQ